MMVFMLFDHKILLQTILKNRTPTKKQNSQGNKCQLIFYDHESLKALNYDRNSGIMKGII